MEFVNVEWVDVNERLPESGEQVLVLGCDYSGDKQLSLAKFIPSRGWVMSGHLNDVCFWIYCKVALPECKCQELAQEEAPMPLEGAKMVEISPSPCKKSGWFSKWCSCGE